MAVQSNLQQDARKRTDDFEREFVATEGGGAQAASSDVMNDVGSVNVIQHLVNLLEKSAQTLRHTAENVENRGLKLLLKVVAQERALMFNKLRETIGKGVVDPLDPARKPAGRSIQQGMQDIQTGMTVQQQGREDFAMTKLLEEEGALLASFDAALDASVPPLWELLNAQRAAIAAFYARLQAVGDGNEPIVARVFDKRVEGEAALMRLREAGLVASQIDAAPISEVTQPVLRSTKNPASAKNTMAAGAICGALDGGLIGLVLFAFVWFSPQLVGWVTVGPMAILFGAMLIGAVFGTVFGFFIGQSQREDDLMVTADGLVNGEILVVAYPQSQQVAMVEDVLQLHHARELNR